MQSLALVLHNSIINQDFYLTYYLLKIHKHNFHKLILHITILVTHKFKIEDRRRIVATTLAQSMTETEIAQELKVD